MASAAQIRLLAPVMVAAGLAVVVAVVLAASGGGSGALAVSRLAVDGGAVLLWAASAAGLGGAALRLLRYEAAHAAMGVGLSAGLGWGVMSVATLGLSVLCGVTPSAATPWVAYVILLPGLLAGVWVLRGAQPPATEEPGSAARWLVALAGVPIGVVLFLALFPTGVLWPTEPNAYDVLAYHFQLPREWYELGAIATYRHNVFSFMPLSMETHYLIAMGMMGGPWAGMYAAQLMHVAFFVAAGAVGYGAVRPAGVVPAVLAAATLAACPHVLMLAPVGYNEGAVVLYGMATVALLFLPERLTYRGVVLAGLCAGFAAGAKLTALPLLVAIPAVAMLLPGKDWAGRRALMAGVFVGVAVVAVSPWLVRTAAATGGNPVFPLATGLLGRGHFSAEQVERFDRAHAPRADQVGLGARVTAFWRQVPGAGEFGYVVLPAAMVCGVLAVRARLARAMLVILSGHVLVWLFATHLQSRFFVPAIPVMAMLVALAAPQVRGGLLAVMVVAGCFALVMVGYRLDFLRTPEGEFQTQFVGVDFRAVQPLFFIDTPEVLRLDPGVTLTLVGDAKAFLYTHPSARLKYTSVFDASGPDVLRAWRAAPGDYLFVSPGELARFGRTYAHVPPLPPEWQGRGPFLVTP